MTQRKLSSDKAGTQFNIVFPTTTRFNLSTSTFLRTCKNVRNLGNYCVSFFWLGCV